MFTSPRNLVALALLVLAKVLGIAGLIVGASHRAAGTILLALDGVLIVAAVAICLATFRARAKAEVAEKQILAKMMQDGTLDQYLAELRADREPDRAPPTGEGDPPERGG
jgi:hypothetical protein